MNDNPTMTMPEGTFLHKKDEQLHTVLGTGPLGMAVMRELLSKGKSVRMVNRSGKADVPHNVDLFQADLQDTDSAKRACEGSAVVYFCANVDYTRWQEDFPPLLDGAIAGTAFAGAILICASNLYMYGPVDCPMTEDLPYKATGRKGRTRAMMDSKVIESHEAGKIKASIGRASDFFGPGVLQSSMGERVFGKAIKGKSADVIGDPDMPHTYTFIDDFGSGLVRLGENEKALGSAWHIPGAETLTTRHFIALIYDELGMNPRIRTMPGFFLSTLAIISPMMRELKEMLYEFDRPFIVDHGKFENAFGAKTTPNRDAIRITIEWYKRHYYPK